MLSGTGKITQAAKGNRTGVLYIPSNLMTDSAFPFELPSSVKITILDDGKLLVEKIN